MVGNFDLIKAFKSDSRGATAVEYGLILALIFLAFIGGVSSYGGSMGEMYNEIGDEIGDVHEGEGGDEPV